MKKLLTVLLFVFIFTSLQAQDSEPGEIVSNTRPLAAYFQDGLWHFVDMHGNDLFEPKQLLDFGGYSGGYYRVKMEVDDLERWLYLDQAGKVFLMPKYDEVYDFINGYALVANIEYIGPFNRVLGMINEKGEEIIEPKYVDLLPFSNGKTYYRTLSERGYFDKKGKKIFEVYGLVGYPFSEGLAAVNDDQYKVGYINDKGETVIDLKFDEAHEFKNGLAFVHTDGKSGYINKKGEFAIPAIYDDGTDPKEGIIFVSKYSAGNTPNWGTIDTKGNQIADFRFKMVKKYSESLAAVMDKDQWGYIDKMGAFLIPPQFFAAEDFVDGLAWVVEAKSRKFGFINTSGEFIREFNEAQRVYDLRLNKQVK